ncbi:MarR family transcriptional regulator [Mediterraneibacter glycyrrhizinilyticus]|uniref:MarR family winged helix-turn-helix transcriptional regulator n=1 Tax=Mediterraneibacter glycyrrhizinilyticus TaxID=342942 RepID=UPI001961DC75|nr:MarR family transcriptional regulator [Mediterraneibacter glycyrrhizinilyticus]MBM6750314.1 MarR family transcriptional regulator [Mediterraneibacter glycyrrhizinilyticus]
MQYDLSNVPDLGLLGIVLHRVMKRAKSKYEEFDLNRSQASILFTLHQRSSMSQKELAESLNMTPPSITSAIRKMEQEGYIRRRQDESDQRVMRLALTEKGAACVENVKRVADEMHELIFQGMSPEEIMLFRRLLIQINENLE